MVDFMPLVEPVVAIAIGELTRMLRNLPGSVTINLVTHPDDTAKAKEDYLRIVNLAPVVIRIRAIRIYREGNVPAEQHELESLLYASPRKDPYGDIVHYRIRMRAEESVFLYPNGLYYVPWSMLPRPSQVAKKELRKAKLFVCFQYLQPGGDKPKWREHEKPIPVVEALERPQGRSEVQSRT